MDLPFVMKQGNKNSMRTEHGEIIDLHNQRGNFQQTMFEYQRVNTLNFMKLVKWTGPILTPPCCFWYARSSYYLLHHLAP